MRSEIGSEFWDVPIVDGLNTIFPSDTVWYLSGRCALRAIIKDVKRKIHFRKVALPSWCCDSMIIPFVEENVEVTFYSVTYTEGRLRQDFSSVAGCDAMLVMDYFGYRREWDYSFDGIVIYDATHGILCGGLRDADYTFGSLRKWAGFYTGGFAFAKEGGLLVEGLDTDAPYIAMRQDAMKQKRQYIAEQSSSKDYLSVFSQAETMLDLPSSGAGSSEDVVAARHLNTEFIRSKRRENAAVLMDSLSDYVIFPELREDDCPLFVPLLLPESDRDALRRHLIAKEIYCPIHWPLTAVHKLDSDQREIYQREISIVCDQRYGLADMQRICSEIRDFLK